MRADYLFGKPVTRERVRVVREAERQWNFREQKWDTDEKETYEGEADESGRFVAKVDLTEAHGGLLDEDYTRFRDVQYAAYFTDASTGRTEQRRFSLRATKEPIHIYVVERGIEQAKGLPLEFYLSASYADGTPASCEIGISLIEDEEEQDGRHGSVKTLPLRTVRTNRFGVAKVSGLALPDSAASTLRFQARDRLGNGGRQDNRFWIGDRAGLRVTADKALYRPDEPVTVQVESSEPGLTVVVDALREWEVVASQVVRMRGRRATVTFSASPAFVDEITFVAYALGRKESANHTPQDSITVLFPRDRSLQVEARVGKAEFRPGEDAGVVFRVRGAEGQPVETALGVVVVDKAVEERARTDAEFGARFYTFTGLLDEADEGISGIRRSELNRLDLSKPLPGGLDLVAEILLQSWGGRMNLRRALQGRERASSSGESQENSFRRCAMCFTRGITPRASIRARRRSCDGFCRRPVLISTRCAIPGASLITRASASSNGTTRLKSPAPDPTASSGEPARIPTTTREWRRQ